MTEARLQQRVQELETELSAKNVQQEIITSIASAATEPGAKGHIVLRALECIGRTNGWVLGQYWSASKSPEVLTCTDFVYASTSLPDFRSASIERRFSPGVGLPGRSFSTGLPLLLNDLSTEHSVNFPRQEIAVKEGLKSGYAFCAKDGHFVRGVFEFYSVKEVTMTASDHWFYEKLGVYIATLMAQEDARDELKKKEVWYRAVVNHAYDAFIGINEASLITDWSEQAIGLFGWEREEVLGRPLADVIIPERYRAAHINGLFRYMTAKEGPILEQRVQAPALTKAGEEIRVELFIFAIESFNEKGFGAFVVDLSKTAKEPFAKLA